MKRLFFIIFIAITLAGVSSCDLFIEMPEVTGNVDKATVFSTRRDAEGHLFSAYHGALKHGMPEDWASTHGTIGSISGELTRGYSWHPMYNIVEKGPNIAGEDYQESRAAGSEQFDQNWLAIRKCWNVYENVDMVEDMPNAQWKEYIKGEALGLIAYRYMGMFYRFGGVPIVRGALQMNDDINIPRATAQEHINFIIELVDEAYAKLPNDWNNLEPGTGDQWFGRLTKGAVLAIKARALTYAARPLFNAPVPFFKTEGLSFPEDQAEIVWMGGYSAKRWEDARDANLAVLNWASSNGHYLIFTAGEGNKNTFENAVRDYGRGTSELYNPEILLAYGIGETRHVANNMNMGYHFGMGAGSEKSQIGLLTNFLRLYRDREGNSIDWPRVGEAAPRPISDFAANIDKIEARFRVDFNVPGKFGLSNPGVSRWESGMSNIGSYTNNPDIAARMQRAAEGRGIGRPTKFFYMTGDRDWFQFPLLRLAENYLHLAEAYNELGETANALKYLNIIRNRAGIPSTEETNQAELRKLIQVEKQLEYFWENHRYFDVKFWKHPEIGTNIIGGAKTEISFYRTASQQTMEYLDSYWDAYSFTGFWHPKWYLEPFLQTEVNKGIIIQNPGW